MAVFNPQVSEQRERDPNYLGYSRAVDAPPANQSTGLALSAAGSSLEGAVQVVDTSIKKGIEKKAYEQIDPERDSYTAALEQAKKDTKGATGTTSSILDANASADTPSVPDGVDQGIDRITQLSEARKAMKINDTQYSGNVLAIAKQLRAQYPGYRDYVDEQVSKVSGLPVANAYYKNLMEDINRQLVQAQGKTDKVEALYLKNLDVPNITSYWWPQYKTGHISEADFIGKIADYQNLQTQYKIDAARRAETDDKTQKGKDAALEDFVKTGTKEIDMGLKDFTIVNGKSSTGALVQYFKDAAAGLLPEEDSAKMEMRKTQLAGAVQAQFLSLWKSAHEVGPDGTSVSSRVGNEDILKKRITDMMIPLTTTLELANSKDSSPAYLTARINQAIADTDKNNTLINRERGPAARQIMNARAIYGDQTFSQVWTALQASGVKDPFLDVFTQEGLAAVAPVTDVRGQPVPRYMKDAIVHGKAIAAPPEYFGAVPEIFSSIANPKVNSEAKEKLIDWAFSPKNKGVLDELKMEYRDPRTGEIVPGKYRLFNLMGADKIIQGVAETAKQKPENYQKFQSTIEQEFGTLFRSDMQNLNKITQKPYLGVHFSWDDSTSSLGLVDKNNKPIVRNERAMGAQYPNAVYLNGVLDVVDRVNGGIKTMGKVQNGNPDGSKIDTTSYIFKTLKDLHLTPEGITGVPGEIMKSIYKSRKPEATPEELNNMLLKFGTEEPKQGPSVSQFVSNPTGVPLPKRVPGQVVGPNEQILGIKNDEIPAGMSVSDFIRQLKKEGRY